MSLMRYSGLAALVGAGLVACAGGDSQTTDTSNPPVVTTTTGAGGSGGGGTDPACGDGVVDMGEECDDGAESAACNSDCSAAMCGDGILNTSAGETCDDMGESATCNADCTAASCGDAVVNATAGEECDDGAESATCNADCTAAVCGDQIVNTAAGEECDEGAETATCDDDCTTVSCGDGTTNTTAGEDCDDGGESALCNADCTAAACGDGIVNMTAGETCDDMGESAACDADCTAVSCGDGLVNGTAGEICDGDGMGVGGETVTCDTDCTPAQCGDMVLNTSAGEVCDDGGESVACDANCTAVQCGDGTLNTTAGEACDDMGESATCNADCTVAACGDGVVNMTAGETCDDMGESAACDSDCTASACGDGVLNTTAGEACDDGNLSPGDGCDATCQVEVGGGDVCQLGPSLSTGFATDNGSSGNFFEITATNNVTVTGFDINVDAGPRDIEVYVREGTYAGFTGAAAGWTQIGAVTVDGQGGDVPTGLPLDIGVTIPAGATYSFYLVSTNAGWNYENGTAEGNVLASDSSITVFEGVGSGGLFGGTFSPRNFSGNVYYRPAGVTTFAGGNSLDGNMFDVAASADVHVKGMNVNLASGTHNLRVYAKRGTYVGSEGTAADWQLLGSATGVESQGPGTPTPLSFPVNLLVPNGETMAFYVTTEGTTMNYTNSTAGALATASGNLNVFVGSGNGYPFAANFAGREWNGTVDNYNATNVTTPLAGGNSAAGNMFDVVATNAIQITGFQQVFTGTTARDVEVYFKRGSHVGSETTAGDWTLIGTHTGLVPDGAGDLTPLVLPVDVDVDAGETVAFYVTNVIGSNAYTNGTGVGNVLASDANLQVLEGVGKTYPFGSTFGPRNWNGRVYYTTCDN